MPQPRRTAAERIALSSTVLPTPRSPVSTTERSGRPAGHAFEHDVEGAQLRVAAGQLGRPLTGAGRVRVADRVHDRTVSGSLAFTADSADRPIVSAPRWMLRRSGSDGGRLQQDQPRYRRLDDFLGNQLKIAVDRPIEGRFSRAG